MDLNNKVVVITGGAGLIGRTFVKTVASHGGIPVIADFNRELGLEFRDKLREELDNQNIYYHHCDICDRKSLEELVVWLNGEFGKVDVLVNNAYPKNQNFGKHFFDVEYKDFADNVSMHLGGYFLTSQVFAKRFFKQGHGNIINMSSIYGVVPPRFEIYEGTKLSNAIEYAAIKAGVLHMTKFMAKYFKGKNIRVNAISPGGILDKQDEVFLGNYKKLCLNKGMLNPEDISGALIFLISDLSEYINGQNIIVDDGFSL